MAGSNSNSVHSSGKKNSGRERDCLDVPNKTELFFAFRSLSFAGFLKTLYTVTEEPIPLSYAVNLCCIPLGISFN